MLITLIAVSLLAELPDAAVPVPPAACFCDPVVVKASCKGCACKVPGECTKVEKPVPKPAPVPPPAQVATSDPAPSPKVRVWAITAADGTRWGDTDPDRLVAFVARRNEATHARGAISMRGPEIAPSVDPFVAPLRSTVNIPAMAPLLAQPLLAPPSAALPSTIPVINGGRCYGGACRR